MIRIAIAGNPNAGKTSIFNHLTGTLQHVSNYPGVTVECKEGTVRYQGHKITVIDLPGTYSLSPYSQEELVARNLVIENKPDVVIDVIDASNLERNLYLAVQLMEIHVPMVIALNMVDVANKRGMHINHTKMEKLLKIPVVKTSGNTGSGTKQLIQTCFRLATAQEKQYPTIITYGHEVDRQVDNLTELLEKCPSISEKYFSRWVAIKLLENDEQVTKRVKEMTGGNHHLAKENNISSNNGNINDSSNVNNNGYIDDNDNDHNSDSSQQTGISKIGKDTIYCSAIDYTRIEELVKKSAAQIEEHYRDDAGTIIAERRYGFAGGVARQVVRMTAQARQNMTDKIDTIVCNRLLGPIIMFAVVAGLFYCVFQVSDSWAWIPWFSGHEGTFLKIHWVSPVELLSWVFDNLHQVTVKGLSNYPMLQSLIGDGVIAGVGGVMSFVPLIFFMFMFISALEDSGYVARVAFIMDRVLRGFGMQGKSILSLIVSGGLGPGCAVPGVLATRTLREEKDRLITMMVTPFMICGAKMPVFAMFIAAFFAGERTEMMFLLWLISWAAALFSALFLRKCVIRGEQTPFVMELPAYHIPTLRGVFLHTWERTWMYMKKAGTVILAINIILWAAMYFPRLPKEQTQGSNGKAPTQQEIASRQLAYSVAGRMGKHLTAITKWAGFDWRTNIALIGGFAAKEVIISTLGTAYAMGDTPSDAPQNLTAKLAHSSNWNRLRAFALMIFVMLYAPCFVTVVALRRESGAWKWPLFTLVYSTTLAFVAAIVIYQVGLAMGWGT